MIPKKYEYANLEVLCQIFKGNFIDTSEKNIVHINYNAKEKIDKKELEESHKS